MTDEEGGVGGKGEAGTSDWRVRAGPRNNPTVREREEHEAKHMPFRDWCTHCVMGRGRALHHVSKKRSEDLSMRLHETKKNFGPLFLTPNSVAKSETTPDESVTCIAVKEERHQNIICSVVLKEKNRITMGKWKSGKIHQLVSVERNQLKSDTELAIIASRNRVLLQSRGHAGGRGQKRRVFKMEWSKTQ